MNLYIFGNGFDLAHGIKTSYYDFKKYFEVIIKGYEIAHSVERVDHKEILVHENRAKIMYLLVEDANKTDYKWSDFEERLGKIDWSKLIYYNSDKSDCALKIKQTIGDYLIDEKNILDYINQLKMSFGNWIGTVNNSIRSAQIPSIFLNLKYDKKDLFINFNYTQTLEKLYGIDPSFVWHIHGNADYNAEGQCIIGHSEKNTKFEYIHNDKDKLLAKKFFDLLRKPTDEIIKEWGFRFEQISNVNEIYIYGSSISKPDIPYFKEIYKNTKGHNPLVHINIYNPNEKESIIGTLKAIGFKRIEIWK